MIEARQQSPRNLGFIRFFTGSFIMDDQIFQIVKMITDDKEFETFDPKVQQDMEVAIFRRLSENLREAGLICSIETISHTIREALASCLAPYSSQRARLVTFVKVLWQRPRANRFLQRRMSECHGDPNIESRIEEILMPTETKEKEDE